MPQFSGYTRSRNHSAPLTPRQLEDEAASNADKLEEQAAKLENTQAAQPNSQEMGRFKTALDAAKLETKNHISMLNDEPKTHHSTTTDLDTEGKENMTIFDPWQDELNELQAREKALRRS